MENNLKKTLSNFVNEPQKNQQIGNNNRDKKVVIDEREGLIERVDKVFVTKDGKQLLREQY